MAKRHIISKNLFHPVKLYCIFLITCILISGFSSCFAQSSLKNNKIEGKWYVNFVHNDIGQARTIIEFNTESNTFTAHTRKGADKYILGRWTSFLGRTFTKSMKNGSLLRIENGIFDEVNDTIHLAGILTTPMGNYNLEGYIVNNELYGTLKNKRGYLGTISGNRTIPDIPMEDYAQLFQNAVLLTESKIFNKDILRSKEWKTFVREMQKSTPKLQDDLEMIFAFFYRADQLSFSHFALMKTIAENETAEKKTAEKKYLTLEEKDENTAYLKMTSFSGTAQEVDDVFKEIFQKKYTNLIVDLRNNSGGSVEAGLAFATRVVDTETFGGVLLTQKWFNNHRELPTPDEYKKFPYFTEANYDLIIEGIHKTEGLCLKIVPKKQVYRGKLYILTNKNTASTCEPIVYELQKQKRAVIIGDTTAGAMLNGEVFELEKGFKMFIPTADYYTSDGFRIDQKGVKPDVFSEDPLKKALSLLSVE